MFDMVTIPVWAACLMTAASVVLSLLMWFLGVCLGVKLASVLASRMDSLTVVTGTTFMMLALVSPLAMAQTLWAVGFFALWLLAAGAMLGLSIHHDGSGYSCEGGQGALKILNATSLVTLGLCLGLLGHWTLTFAAKPDLMLGERLPMILLPMEMLVALLNGFFAHGVYLRNEKARTEQLSTAERA